MTKTEIDAFMHDLEDLQIRTKALSNAAQLISNELLRLQQVFWRAQNEKL